MKRYKVKPKHPIKIVRKITGKTQRDMAGMLNVTRSRYGQIEAGILPMSRSMAFVVFVETGAIIPEGYGEEGQLPECLELGSDYLKEFTEEFYFSWQYQKSINSDERREFLTFWIHSMISHVLCSATIGGHLQQTAAGIAKEFIPLLRRSII